MAVSIATQHYENVKTASFDVVEGGDGDTLGIINVISQDTGGSEYAENQIVDVVVSGSGTGSGSQGFRDGSYRVQTPASFPIKVGSGATATVSVTNVSNVLSNIECHVVNAG